MGDVVTLTVLKMDENHSLTHFSTFCFDVKSLVEARDTLGENHLVRKIQIECRDYKILIVIEKEGSDDV